MLKIFVLIAQLAVSVDSSKKSASKLSAAGTKSDDNSKKKWSDDDIKMLKERIKEMEKALKDVDQTSDDSDYNKALKKISTEKGFLDWKSAMLKMIKLGLAYPEEKVKNKIADLAKKCADKEIVKEIAETFGDKLLPSFFTLIVIQGLQEGLDEIQKSAKPFYLKPGFYVAITGLIGLIIGITLMMMEFIGDKIVTLIVVIASVIVAIGGAVLMFIQRGNKIYQFRPNNLDKISIGDFNIYLAQENTA
jgi:hypothetical protein